MKISNNIFRRFYMDDKYEIWSMIIPCSEKILMDVIIISFDEKNTDALLLSSSVNRLEDEDYLDYVKALYEDIIYPKANCTIRKALVMDPADYYPKEYIKLYEFTS